jgi:NADPH-dependent 2,4-dienoyl-CoA reductase/sulfur reductase-like enzyme
MDSSETFFRPMEAGARALAINAVASLPVPESTRLANGLFTIAVNLTAQPAVATITITGDPAPIYRVPAAVWPDGFGPAIGRFAEEAVNRLDPDTRRNALAVMGHPQTCAFVVLEPAEGTYRVELRHEDKIVVLGTMANPGNGLTH